MTTNHDPGDEHVDRDVKPDNMLGLVATTRTPPSATEQVAEIAALPPNWYDGYRRTIGHDDSLTAEAKATALLVASQIENAGLTTHVYPVPGGGLQFEWDASVTFDAFINVVEIEVLPSGEVDALTMAEANAPTATATSSRRT